MVLKLSKNLKRTLWFLLTQSGNDLVNNNLKVLESQSNVRQAST